MRPLWAGRSFWPSVHCHLARYLLNHRDKNYPPPRRLSYVLCIYKLQTELLLVLFLWYHNRLISKFPSPGQDDNESNETEYLNNSQAAHVSRLCRHHVLSFVIFLAKCILHTRGTINIECTVSTTGPYLASSQHTCAPNLYFPCPRVYSWCPALISLELCL